MLISGFCIIGAALVLSLISQFFGFLFVIGIALLIISYYLFTLNIFDIKYSDRTYQLVGVILLTIPMWPLPLSKYTGDFSRLFGNYFGLLLASAIILYISSLIRSGFLKNLIKKEPPSFQAPDTMELGIATISGFTLGLIIFISV